MFRVLILIQLLTIAAYGQQFNGPFEITRHIGTDSIRCPQILLRNDSLADVFFQIGDTVHHSVVATGSGLAMGQLHTFPASDSGFAPQLYNVTKTDSGWAAITYDTSVPENRTMIYQGRDGIGSAMVVDSGRNWATQTNGSNWNRNLAITRKTGGGFYTSWIKDVLQFNGSFWVEDIYLQIEQFRPAEYSPRLQTTCVEHQESECLIQPMTQDSTLALTFHDDSPFTLCRIMDYPQGTNVWSETYNCTGTPVEFLATHAGRFFVLLKSSETSNQPRLVELTDNFSCSEMLALNSDPLASASHPDFGMAWLTLSGGLLLSRVDSNGTAIGSAGAVYWPDEDHQIMDAKLAISDQGRIAALWTERDLLSPETTILKIATLDWNSTLGVEDSHFDLHPSSFILSTFPNPFNNEVQVHYELPQAQEVELAVFNVLGQKVSTLVSGFKRAGSNTVDWKPETGAGVYFVTLKTQDFVKTKKILYLK